MSKRLCITGTIGAVLVAALFLVLVIGTDVVNAEDKGMALRIAASNGQLEEVERLLNEGADIDARSDNGMTPLILASWRGHTKVVELLLREGADVDATTNKGTTALRLATERGHKEIIRMLQEAGATE
jgi:ankyrin repeat protein